MGVDMAKWTIPGPSCRRLKVQIPIMTVLCFPQLVRHFALLA